MADTGSLSALTNDLDALFSQLETDLVAGQGTPDTVPDAFPADRRQSPRREPAAFGREIKLTVRGAAEARPIDLSETGLLAETNSRLLPGTVVELLLQIDGTRHLLRATIVRSVVHALSPRPLFRTAFRFEEPANLPERR